MSDIYCSPNGWLFLTGGNNNVLDIYSGKLNDESWIEKWMLLIKNRKKKLAEKNIDYYHISVPEKIAVYFGFLENDILNRIDLSKSPATILFNSLQESEKENYIDPTPYLRSQSETYQVYHATDSHWNFLGAYSCYQLLMSRIGLSASSSIKLDISKKSFCTMDLGGKLTPPVTEEVFFYSPSSTVKRIFSNKIVDLKERESRENDIGLHVGSIVEYENLSALHDLRVLVFGDSFSEYRTHLLTGLLAETFRNVRFVWGTDVDSYIVNDFVPNIVITEIAERFMPYRVPTDTVSFDEYEKKILKDLES